MAEVKVVDGNQAAAIGVKLAKPDIIAAYPITPQSPLVEHLAQFKADDELNSSIREVESELSAMSVIQGATLAGARTFTATSSQGLSLMYEPYFRTSTLRLPVVMVIVNREMNSPQTVWGSPQDSLSVRDAGWLQIYVEDNQEILDMVIQAFKIAEDERVQLPVNICYTGFYLSHLTEVIEVPNQKDVDRFLSQKRERPVRLDPEKPMAIDPMTPGSLLTKYRESHLYAQQQALAVIEEVNRGFEDCFGRSYGGLIETYRLEHTDFALITLGSDTGAARVAIDEKRKEGVNIGLIKIRSVRPFPVKKLSHSLKDKKAFGVVDRNVSFGWNSGIIYQEVCSTLPAQNLTSLSFIGGLGGADITITQLREAIKMITKASQNEKSPDTPIWLSSLA